MPARKYRLWLLAAFAAALFASPALAQTQEQIDSCIGKNDTAPAQKVASCTAIIESGKISGKDLAVAYVLRGEAYDNADDSAKAFADFDQAIKLDPQNGHAFSSRGLAYMNKENFDAAIADFDKAIALAPQDPSPWAYEGDALYHSGKSDDALISFAGAIRRDPNWMWPYNDRGELYLDQGNIPLALADFDQVVSLASATPMGWNNRCRARAISGDLDGALADCNQAIKLSAVFVNHMEKSGEVSAIGDRALVQLKAGHFDLAVSDYDKALALTPKSAEVLYGRGTAKLKSGDKSGDADVAAAKKIKADIATVFAGYGVK